MEKTQVVEALARVSTLAQRIIESEKNSNDLVDLIEYLDVGYKITLKFPAHKTRTLTYFHIHTV